MSVSAELLRDDRFNNIKKSKIGSDQELGMNLWVKHL